MKTRSQTKQGSTGGMLQLKSAKHWTIFHGHMQQKLLLQRSENLLYLFIFFKYFFYVDHF